MFTIFYNIILEVNRKFYNRMAKNYTELIC